MTIKIHLNYENQPFHILLGRREQKQGVNYFTEMHLKWQGDVIQPWAIKLKILLYFVLNISRHYRQAAGEPDITYVITLEVFQ